MDCSLTTWLRSPYHLETMKEKDIEAYEKEKPIMSHAERAKEFEEYFGFAEPNVDDVLEDTKAHKQEYRRRLWESVKKGIDEKWVSYEEFRPGFAVEAARIATVVTIDDEWKMLLQKMDALKQTVGLAQYKGSDPLKEYQIQGFNMYRKVENKYKARSVSRWLRSKPKQQEEAPKKEYL
jgi:preprotein translocase subunit SecA